MILSTICKIKLILGLLSYAVMLSQKKFILIFIYVLDTGQINIYFFQQGYSINPSPFFNQYWWPSSLQFCGATIIISHMTYVHKPVIELCSVPFVCLPPHPRHVTLIPIALKESLTPSSGSLLDLFFFRIALAVFCPSQYWIYQSMNMGFNSIYIGLL